jgi:hypothetical protein
MFWRLRRTVETEGLTFQHISRISRRSTNARARGTRHHRRLGPCLRLSGGSLRAPALRRLGGRWYGPIVVARRTLTREELRRARIAIPGRLTTAFLALQIYLGAAEFDAVVLPFDQILEETVAGRFDAGLLIHEGQLTYAAQGAVNVLTSAPWWKEYTGGLPLPLGLNAARRALAARRSRASPACCGARSRRAGAARRGRPPFDAFWPRTGRRPYRPFRRHDVNEFTLDLANADARGFGGSIPRRRGAA